MRKFTAIAAAFLTILAAAPGRAQTELKIMAPAAPGGGWDQTARAMQQALITSGLAKSVQVVNVPGAGGTVGLAQFVTGDKGNATKLIVGGYVMVGAIIANKSPVSLADVTPLARLTGEYDAIVVPKDSPIKSMAELVDKLKADPGAVSWAGGSAGGVDHIAVGLIAKAVGVDPTKINYIPYSGGGEALAAVLGSQVTAGISGYGEFEGQVKAGELRLLALTGGPGGPDLPTLKSQGIDVDVQNWRMVAAAPGITDAEKADLVATVEAMANSDQWKAVVSAKGWQNTFLAGDAFAAYLDEQVKATTAVLKDLGIAE
jgi:putative tricarboxylic transport membrane protein